VYRRAAQGHQLSGSAATVFRPRRALGVTSGSLLALIAAGTGAIAVLIAVDSEPELRTAVAWCAATALAGVALMFASWTACIASLSYSVRPNELEVRWGLRRVLIPLETIQAIVPGRTVDRIQVRGLNWPGCHVGTADVNRVGHALVFATEINPQHMVLVVTSDESYALTLSRPASFAEEVESYRGISFVETGTGRASAHGIAGIPFWRDRSAMAAGAAMVALALGLLCLLYGAYPSLSPVVEIGFPGTAPVVRVGSRDDLLDIAYVGLALAALNVVAGAITHSWERAAGLWLLYSGIGLQCLLVVAALVALVGA
jgi:hypothetical protein